MSAAATWRILRIAAAPAAVWCIFLLRGNIWFRLYPAIMVAAFLVPFAASLAGTPLVETFARRMGANLDEAGVAYCRKATVAWTAFLSLHLAATVATVFMEPRVWAVYNGFVAYILIGGMFLGEFIARKRASHGR